MTLATLTIRQHADFRHSHLNLVAHSITNPHLQLKRLLISCRENHQSNDSVVMCTSLQNHSRTLLITSDARAHQIETNRVLNNLYHIKIQMTPIIWRCYWLFVLNLLMYKRNRYKKKFFIFMQFFILLVMQWIFTLSTPNQQATYRVTSRNISIGKKWSK